MASEAKSRKEGKFGIGEAVRFGWKVTLKNFWFLVVIMIIDFVLNGGSYTTNNSENIDSSVLTIAIIGGLAIAVFAMIVRIGMKMIFIKLSRGEKTGFGELVAHYRRFWSYLGASILYGFVVTAGLILLVVPGIIWGIKYSMFSYLIVDKKMSALEALRESSKITMGEKWPLFLFGLLSILIAIAGFLALGIGAFFAIPTIYLATAYIYLKLSGQKTASV